MGFYLEFTMPLACIGCLVYENVSLLEDTIHFHGETALFALILVFFL